MNKYLFTKEQEQKIIDYYLLPQSLSETAKHFGISSREVIKKVLIKNNISCHSETVLKKVHQNNIEQSNLLKYGYKNVFQDSRIKNKIKQTNKQKYGVENPQQVKNIKLKTKETNILKYGGTGFASSILNKKVQCIVKEKYCANNISNTYYNINKSQTVGAMSEGTISMAEQEMKNNQAFVEKLNSNIGDNTRMETLENRREWISNI